VFWVALSGGLDSIVLLHAAVAAGIKVSAVHVHHNLSPHADHWAEFCESFCEQWSVPFECRRVELNLQGKGLEDAARQARYAAFDQVLGKACVLLTAHHQDDQAETLLLRLMRGAGPKGLAAMSERRECGEFQLWRPLLSVPKVELQHYAQDHQLEWVEDESNQDEDFDRNYLRRQVMPLLSERWPGFAERWQQSAMLCGAVDQAMEAQAEVDLVKADWRVERIGHSLDLNVFESLDSARRWQLLRSACEGEGVPAPGLIHLQTLDNQRLIARADAQIAVSWGAFELRPFQSRLYLIPSDVVFPLSNTPLPWGGEGCLALARGQLSASATTAGQALSLAHAPFTVKMRSGGERCRPSDRAHSQSLKKLFLERGLEPWLRDCVPLIYVGEILAAVGDLWVCEGFQSVEGEEGIDLCWTP
jgi:tRNA(Ile)-lysidine synthase